MLDELDSAAVDGAATRGTAGPTLVAEAHHRIANSLATVSALLRSAGARLGGDADVISVAEARTGLGAASGRVDAVATLHKLLSAQGGSDAIAVGAYLQGIAANLVGALADAGLFRLQCQVDVRCELSAGRALKLGLVVSEFVINAIKYSHPTGVPGNIWLTVMRRDDRTLWVEVADDGVGLPAATTPTENGHHGTHLVRGLCAQLQANLRYQTHDLGLRCTIEMPLTTAD